MKTSLKYGLNPAAKKKKKLAPKPLSGPIAAFAGGDSDGEEAADATHKSRGNIEVLRQQAAAKRDQKVRERVACRARGEKAELGGREGGCVGVGRGE